MSKKRSQRKNSNYNYRPGQKAGEDPQALQENSRTKKFSPAACWTTCSLRGSPWWA